MIPDIIKNSPSLAKQKSDAKSLPLKYVNEALLDAGRGGQTVLRMPTSETVLTIEGWSEIDTRRFTEEQLRKLKESRMSVTKNYRNFPKLWKNEFGTEVRSVTGPKGNTWYEVDVPEKFFQINPSKPAEIKTYSKGGKALKGLIKKYGAGGSVSGWGAQGNFSTEYTSRQPEVEELPHPMALAQDNSLSSEVEELNLTPEEEKEAKKKKALALAGKGAMMGMKFGPWGALAGGVIGGAIGWFAKQGMKIKKLYNQGGGVSSPEKKPDVKDLIYQLESYGKETRNPKELWELMDSLRRKPHGSWNIPPDEDVWAASREDVLKYLSSRGIDTKGKEIDKTYIIPGPYADLNVNGWEALGVSEKGRLYDPTKPSKPDIISAGDFGAPPFTNSRGRRIKIASRDIKDPTTRIEENIHSLQQQKFLDSSITDSKIGGNKRRLYRMLKKQPWVQDLSPEDRYYETKGNYALKGSGSTSEFEAKLIAAKMTMIHEGVLPSSGKVSDKDLEAIRQWYKSQEGLSERELFHDISNPKYRDEILKTLNKL
jgi:hypothetical protein